MNAFRPLVGCLLASIAACSDDGDPATNGGVVGSSGDPSSDGGIGSAAGDGASGTDGGRPGDSGRPGVDSGTPSEDGGPSTDSGTPITPSSNGGPLLLFTDLVNGPNTGNSDTSKGAGGAIVTVWGRSLGSSQGGSTVKIGNVDAPVYEWRNASGPAADMYTRHGMEMISFLVPSTAPVGEQDIQVMVGGTTSNTLKFTVRAQGNIYHVKTTGNDNGNGSWNTPWRTIPKAVDTMANGDIIYVGDGVTATTTHQFHGCVNLSEDGTAAMPRALVAYPGATVNVGGTCDDPFGNFNGGGNKLAEHWVVSKMRALGGDQSAISAFTGYRLVGNYVSMNRPSDNCQSGAISGQGNDLAIFGNQLTNTARDNQNTVSKLCHTIYISGQREGCNGRCPTESNREIGWNLLNDNYDNRGINIYSEQSGAAFIENHRVHDNYIINHRGDGMLIGYYMTGENYYYNNVIVNAGLGPEWGGEISGHYAMQISAGHESNRPTTLHIVNNTIYGGGFPQNSGSAAIEWSPRGQLTLEFKNNIVVSPDVPYVSGSGAPSTSTPNLWFGQSAPPSWNTGALAVDPMFVNAQMGDLHLKQGSPAIDKGAATSFPVDFDGLVRPQGAAFDIGAFEYK